MKIETQLKFNEYLKFQYILSYSKPMVIITTFLSLMLIGYSVISNNYGISDDDLFFVTILSTFVVSRPLLIYAMARKSFFTDKIIQDPITYEFFDDHMTVTIPNGFSSFTWDKIYKVVEYKNLFMIYRSSRLANMIPKTNMKDNEIIELKNILKNAQGLKVKLKNG